jgi:glycosyltransferase involved in cell wall biosynthesis
MTGQPKCIHLWVSGLEETGGIQHYSACCIRALRMLFPRARLRVFSKNDMVGGEDLHVFGHLKGWRKTAAFTAFGLGWALLERPDFILTTHPHFMKALAPLTHLGIPCLTSAHGIEVWGRLQGSLGTALRQATGLLPVSDFTRRVIHQEAGIPLRKMPVVPNTFREEAFAPGPRPPALLKRYGLQEGQPVILTVGRLSAAERYKGHDQVLRALPRVLQELPELHYLIGGIGDDECRLRALVSELGLQRHVTFTGFIPTQELAEHFRLCDLYVMPSTGEGFGIVYLEALACGRACLVGSEDASPEAVDGGRLGWVVSPQDIPAIADAVLRFFSRRHEKPWLHEPEVLHREVVRLYGYQAFLQSLSSALVSLGLAGPLAAGTSDGVVRELHQGSRP